MIGQILQLLTNGNGTGSPGGVPVGSAMQWFGGKAKVFAWNSIIDEVTIEVSPDGGTTWIKVGAVENDGVLVSQSLPLAFSGDFSEPAMLVRAVGGSSSNSRNLNVALIG